MEDYHNLARPRIAPEDDRVYFVNPRVVEFTIRILEDYKQREGLVYWSGVAEGNISYVSCAVAPKIKSNRYNFSIDYRSNEQFVSFICENGLQYVSQVHSHPGKVVDHSETDDENAAFRSEGLVSIVVPSYGKQGMRPLTICGIHRFNNNEFQRLNNHYIDHHFKIEDFKKPAVILKDFRK